MADLKNLQAMAREGKISEELLKDDKFKTELKRILKEECKVEITDEDIPKVVKNLEETLKEIPDDAKVKQVLSKEEVENVSGGVSKAKIIKGVSAIVGYILGAQTSDKIYMSKFASQDLKDYIEKLKQIHSNEKSSSDEKIDSYDKLNKEFAKEHPELIHESIMAGARNVVAGAATSYGSYKLADYLCKKFDIK